jgi:hypothetical protein
MIMYFTCKEYLDAIAELDTQLSYLVSDTFAYSETSDTKLWKAIYATQDKIDALVFSFNEFMEKTAIRKGYTHANYL